MQPIILFRESLTEQSELDSASQYFPVYKYHTDIPKKSLVFGRYSVLPFYEWVEEDLKRKDCKLVNTYAQHKYIANFEYYKDVEDLTFKTWFAPSDLTEADAPFVIKGKTNSRKSDWNGSMFAKTVQDAIKQGCDLQQDSLIGQQDIIYRKYIPLETYEIGVNGLPFTNEWRVFVYKDTILSNAYYWSNAENAETRRYPEAGFKEFALKVVDRLKDKLDFYVIDIARTADLNWILVEVNDAQMSGLSMTNAEILYSNLSKALEPKPVIVTKYKADMQVEKYHAQGWDNYTNTYEYTLVADSEAELNEKIDKFIKQNTSNSKGDFGITLSESTPRLIRKYKAEETSL